MTLDCAPLATLSVRVPPRDRRLFSVIRVPEQTVPIPGRFSGGARDASCRCRRSDACGAGLRGDRTPQRYRAPRPRPGPSERPTPTPSPTTGQGTLTRVAGADRIATSVRISQIGFPNKLSATAVVLARADDFADELAGGPLAARFQGPLLLTPSAGLTDAVRLEIQRVLAVGHTVYLLGGTDAISANVGTNLQALGYNPVRVDGTDRYDTAVKIANILGDPPTVFEVDGTNFPDGLSAGPAAALSHGVILLTAGHVQAPETAQYLATHPTDVRYAIGGPAAAADPTAQPLVGADRYATSILVANQLFASPSIVAIASGVAFPDALSGGALAGIDGAPMLLGPKQCAAARFDAELLRQVLQHRAVGVAVRRDDGRQHASGQSHRTSARPGAVRVLAAGSASTTLLRRFYRRARRTAMIAANARSAAMPPAAGLGTRFTTGAICANRACAALPDPFDAGSAASAAAGVAGVSGARCSFTRAPSITVVTPSRIASTPRLATRLGSRRPAIVSTVFASSSRVRSIERSSSSGSLATVDAPRKSNDLVGGG